jgi:hypothetical protein
MNFKNIDNFINVHLLLVRLHGDKELRYTQITNNIKDMHPTKSPIIQDLSKIS